jgi:methanogenic corrinoid protein MtbC1
MSLIDTALKKGIKPSRIVKSSLKKAMIDIGVKFIAGKLYYPDLLFSLRIIKSAFIISSSINDVNNKSFIQDTIIVGTVHEDLYDIGKNIIAVIGEILGFKIVDLGAGLDSEILQKGIERYTPQITGIIGPLHIIRAIDQTLLAGVQLEDRVLFSVAGTPVVSCFPHRYGIELIIHKTTKATKHFIKIVEKAVGVRLSNDNLNFFGNY